MRALLLDLDDTLLHNSMEAFLPRYFRALSATMSDYIEREALLRALHHATQAMISNTDPAHTNEAVFWRAFEPLLPVSRATIAPRLAQFYDEQFPTLADVTARIEGAEALLQATKAAGWRVAIATNPVFPRRAIEHRIAWAGLAGYELDCVTAYETMHYTKPHPQYFAQVAEQLGVPPSACVMAGNHLSNDLVGAAAVGMQTFWVTHYPIDDAAFTPDGQGSLDALRHWLFNGRE